MASTELSAPPPPAARPPAAGACPPAANLQCSSRLVFFRLAVLKDGKIVVLLQGRYAGKKAVILKTDDEGGKERSYGHCVVAGETPAFRQ